MLANDYLSLRLVRLKSGEEWVGESDDHLAFLFLKGGSGNFVSSSPARALMPGDVLVFDSALKGKLTPSNGNELAFWWFSLSSEHLFPLFAIQELCLLQEIVGAFKPSKLYPASTPLASECHKLLGEVPPNFDLAHRSQLLRVAAAILGTEFKNAQSHRTGYVSMDEHLSQVFEKLSLEDVLTLSVGELAKRFGCSRRHLNRLFHQHFGFSVAALRMEMRLLKAVTLLRDPSTKVIIVAEQCGFNHLGLFNTCFRRRFGASPGEWRKQTPPPATQAESPVSADTPCRLRSIGLCPWSDNAPHTVNSRQKPILGFELLPADPRGKGKQPTVANQPGRLASSKYPPNPTENSGPISAHGL